jgi:threonine dehydrogenase-like Zn-dependent dehydrogenase
MLLYLIAALSLATLIIAIEDRRAQRLEHARKMMMLQRAATRARRAMTVEKRWKRRVTALCRRIPTGV